MPFIYAIENIHNQKVYVGQTSTSIFTRIEFHRKFPCSELDFDFQTHPENYRVYTLCECLKEELDEKEKEWIKFFDSTNPEKGYNLTEGGRHASINTKRNKEIEVYDLDGTVIATYPSITDAVFALRNLKYTKYYIKESLKGRDLTKTVKKERFFYNFRYKT